MTQDDQPRPVRGTRSRWLRVIGLVVVGGALVWLKLADPFEGAEPQEDSPAFVVMAVLVIGLGVAALWLAATMGRRQRQQLQDGGKPTVRLLARLPLPLLRILFALAGVAVIALGVLGLLD